MNPQVVTPLLPHCYLLVSLSDDPRANIGLPNGCVRCEGRASMAEDLEIDLNLLLALGALLEDRNLTREIGRAHV